MLKLKVSLIGHSNSLPLAQAKQAATCCYQETMPELETEETEKDIEFVKKKLFKTGHHTTIEHSYFTFVIEGVAVGDVTFGLHLTHPFYNSDQRSGRFCSEMFLKPDFESIADYLTAFWPELEVDKINAVMSFIEEGISLYQNNLKEAISVTAKLLRQERPNWNEEMVLAAAPKIAQEQLRAFISVIFPTALTHTIDLCTLVAMWESAFSPSLRFLTEQMKESVLGKFPNLSFMFDDNRRRKTDWACEMATMSEGAGRKDCLTLFSPELMNLQISNLGLFQPPTPDLMHPVDKLLFTPELMDNNIASVTQKILISVATMGQDQRHRTVERSTPFFSGYFYVPPIVQQLKLDSAGFFKKWLGLQDFIPPSMFMTIAPYGAMVCYEKRGKLGALLHEQGKRLCFCAQEEIYNLGRQLRLAIKQRCGDNEPLLKFLEPPCYHSGVCAEGARCCGRNIALRENPTMDYFPQRKV